MKKTTLLFCFAIIVGIMPSGGAQAATVTCQSDSPIAVANSNDLVEASCVGLRLNRQVQSVTYTPAFSGAGTYCLTSKSATTDYFIPAKTKTEWDSFLATAEGLNIEVKNGPCCPSVKAAGKTWCAIPPEGVVGCHQYLYYLPSREAWYISPVNCSGWNWNYYTEQQGVYFFGHGPNTEGSFACFGGENYGPYGYGGYGVGCSTGGGNRLKVLPLYGSSPSANTGIVCQDQPGYLGGPGRHIGPGLVCATGANFYYSTD